MTVWYVSTLNLHAHGYHCAPCVQLMISNEDLKELEIPMGPRKKLASFISSQGEKIRAAKVNVAEEREEEREGGCH